MVSVTHAQAQKVTPPCRVMNMEACSWKLITFLVAIWIRKKTVSMLVLQLREMVGWSYVEK